MQEHSLKKIFLILSLLGILILTIIAQNIKPSEKLKDGSYAVLTGTIKSINPGPKSTAVYLENSSISLVIISSQILNLKENQIIEAHGKIQIENNKTSLIADKIICKNCN